MYPKQLPLHFPFVGHFSKHTSIQLNTIGTRHHLWPYHHVCHLGGLYGLHGFTQFDMIITQCRSLLDLHLHLNNVILGDKVGCGG